MKHAPWYKRYPQDLMSDPFVQAMSDEQYAWYSKALDLSWIATPKGFLPNAKHLLGRMLAKCSEAHWLENCQIVLDRFSMTEDGLHLYHPKMVEQVENYEQVVEKRRVAGEQGGKAKAQNRLANAKQVLGTAVAKGVAKPSEAEAEAEEPIDIESNGSPAIELIYAAYPRKVGKRKALVEIEHAHKRLVRGEKPMPPMSAGQAFEYLANRARAFAGSPAGNNGDYTPHPSTWFHQSRYLDDEQEWQLPGRRVNAEQRQQEPQRNRAEQRQRDNFAAAAGAAELLGLDIRTGSSAGHHAEPTFDERSAGGDGTGIVGPVTAGNRVRHPSGEATLQFHKAPLSLPLRQ